MVTLMEFQNKFSFCKSHEFQSGSQEYRNKVFPGRPTTFFFFHYNNLKLGTITIWVSNSGKYRGLSGFPFPTPLGCIKKREHFFQDTKNWIALSTRGLTFVLYSLFYKFWHLSSSFMLSEKSEFNSFYFSW